MMGIAKPPRALTLGSHMGLAALAVAASRAAGPFVITVDNALADRSPLLDIDLEPDHRRIRNRHAFNRVFQAGPPKDITEFISERPLTKRQRRRQKGKRP